MMDWSIWMRTCINEAMLSLPQDVPVSALILDMQYRTLIQTHNQREKLKRVSAHAEILAIEQLKDTTSTLTLITTLQPCLMCTSAILDCHNISRVVFGAYDQEPQLIYATDLLIEKGIEVVGGVLENDCAKLLKDYFASIRLP
ncbi:MAG: nucleoside deaminase [Bifidobacteriaceae bacterium]|jgi:tRNA(adenine34) deaminase|nr:nucleoside deaminase [Bifidobacteriaceae bacterium]